ncbi:MAG: hypothetical protein RI965_352, partial [Bacteroidota bacterium]
MPFSNKQDSSQNFVDLDIERQKQDSLSELQLIQEKIRILTQKESEYEEIIKQKEVIFMEIVDKKNQFKKLEKEHQEIVEKSKLEKIDIENC